MLDNSGVFSSAAGKRAMSLLEADILDALATIIDPDDDDDPCVSHRLAPDGTGWHDPSQTVPGVAARGRATRMGTRVESADDVVEDQRPAWMDAIT